MANFGMVIADGIKLFFSLKDKIEMNIEKIAFESHPLMVYPRKMNGQQSLGAICPACRSGRVDLFALSPERAFKRQSICLDCHTVWTTRNASVPLRYKQRFYQ